MTEGTAGLAMWADLASERVVAVLPQVGHNVPATRKTPGHWSHRVSLPEYHSHEVKDAPVRAAQGQLKRLQG